MDNNTQGSQENSSPTNTQGINTQQARFQGEHPPVNQAVYGADGRLLPPPYIPPAAAAQQNLPSASANLPPQRSMARLANCALWLGIVSVALLLVQFLFTLAGKYPEYAPGWFVHPPQWCAVLLKNSDYFGYPCQLAALIMGKISLKDPASRKRGIAGMVLGGVSMVLRVMQDMFILVLIGIIFLFVSIIFSGLK